MKISIITVCYNSDKTIEDTLKSVLSQIYKNYEYIIVDGLSKDNTIPIIKKYESLFEGRLKYISEKDKGLYDAMNKGIKMSTGDIIGIINSDDVLAHENVFLNIINNIENYDGVYSNLKMLDEKLCEPYRIIISKNVSKKRGWHPPHPTLYLKKEVYEKYGIFNINYKISADYDFMLRIINKGCKLKYVNDYFVYMRAGGVSTNGLKGYHRNYKDSYNVLRQNGYKFPMILNILRIFEIIHEKRLAKKELKNKKEFCKK